MSLWKGGLAKKSTHFFPFFFCLSKLLFFLKFAWICFRILAVNSVSDLLFVVVVFNDFSFAIVCCFYVILLHRLSSLLSIGFVVWNSLLCSNCFCVFFKLWEISCLRHQLCYTCFQLTLKCLVIDGCTSQSEQCRFCVFIITLAFSLSGLILKLVSCLNGKGKYWFV